METTNISIQGMKSWLLSTIHSKLLQNLKPITDFLKKGNKYVWSEACDEAFKHLKKLLTTSPMLA
jgi:hypothetical protein